MEDLLDTKSLSLDTIYSILDLAGKIKIGLSQNQVFAAFKGKTVCNLFFEDSTRTRLSFELASKKLGLDVLNFNIKTSALNKGESFRDTIETISAMGVDIIIIRHPHSGAPCIAKKLTDSIIVNAGDGSHQHPTQALIDLFTIEEVAGIEGKIVTICGDIKNSRVARSNIELFNKFDCKVVLVGPKTLLPTSLAPWNVSVSTNLDAVLEIADFNYFLRIQKERISQNSIPDEHDYVRLYGLTKERVSKMKPNAFIMHPGPVNRGIELSSDALNSERSLVLKQVENSLPIRMSILTHLLKP